MGLLTTIVITAVVTFAMAFILIKIFDHLRRKDAEREAAEIVARAKQEAESRRREGELQIKELLLKQQDESEKEARKIRGELHERERLLDKRQDALEEQADQVRKQEKIVETSQRKLTERIQEANHRKDELSKLLDVQRQTLHQLSGLSQAEATRRLLEILDAQLQQETGAAILRYDKQLAEICEQKSREIIVSALQRYAAAHTAESTTSTVGIPNDEMKGRIIGREGRNIRAFEKATGVDLIIDDTPGVVIVSGFDTIRREVARLALNKLIVDGRIHPARIEEIVIATQKELEKHIQKLGEDACQELAIHGLHERLVHLLGRLQFRTSYSQNVLRHSIEVAFIAGMMAEEVGLDGAAGPALRPVARHRQGGRPRGRGRPPQDRRRPVEALRRAARSGSCRLRPPRRPADRQSVHGARGRGRRLQRRPARRPPRESGALRQANGGTRADRRRLRGRRAGLRHPGRPRAPRAGQFQGNHRRGRRQDLP